MNTRGRSTGQRPAPGYSQRPELAGSPARRRLCDTRDPEWWATGDDGNRLAILLCAVCPLGCPDNDDQPAGVIRGGKAYSDAGRVHPMCPCGYPAATDAVHKDPDPNKPAPVHLCRRCQTPTIDLWRDVIIRKRAAGMEYKKIAAGGVPFHHDHIRRSYTKWTTPEPTGEADLT